MSSRNQLILGTVLFVCIVAIIFGGPQERSPLTTTPPPTTNNIRVVKVSNGANELLGYQIIDERDSICTHTYTLNTKQALVGWADECEEAQRRVIKKTTIESPNNNAYHMLLQTTPTTSPIANRGKKPVKTVAHVNENSQEVDWIKRQVLPEILALATFPK